jgi:hypothetical protein
MRRPHPAGLAVRALPSREERGVALQRTTLGGVRQIRYEKGDNPHFAAKWGLSPFSRHLTELPQLHQARIRINEKEVLRELPKTSQHRLVLR